MADYYRLIASVVEALENNSAELRRRLYESARTGFLVQMRKLDPPLSDSYITQEQIALEEAIRKVEAEQMGRMAATTNKPSDIDQSQREQPTSMPGIVPET